MPSSDACSCHFNTNYIRNTVISRPVGGVVITDWTGEFFKLPYVKFFLAK